MRFRAVLLTCASVALSLSLPRAAMAGEVGIRRIETSDFPTATVTVSIKGERVDEGSVRISENGRTIVPTSVEPLSEAGRDVQIVLVLDTSGSMQGGPIASATTAALRFVTKTPDEIDVGILTFSDRPKLLSRLGSGRGEALNALGGLRAEGETALYDAVKTATGMFSGDAQRNVIVLSDGADTASKATLDAATGAAQRTNATVFTVGLTSGEFDERALRRLSDRTGGRYSPVATASLASLYQNLATELSSQYLVSYESKHVEGGEVTVTVTAAGGSDTILALTPKVEAPAERPRESGSEQSLMLTGTGGLALTLAVCFATAFVFAMMLVGANHRNRRDRELKRRTAAAASERFDIHEDDRGAAGWIPEPFVHAAERVTPVGTLGKMENRLERAGVPLRAGEFVVGTVLVAIIGSLFGMLLTGNVLFSLLFAAVCAVAPRLWLAVMVRRRSNSLHAQLADVLMIVANALRAGHSFFQALDLVAKEVASPAKEEFNRVVAEVRLGRPVNEAMDALAERVGSEDFKWALLAVNIQREVGGNLAEVLDTVSDTIRERDAIRRQVDVLTAEGRLSVAILTGLPIVVALYMSWVNPEYVALLINNPLGLIMTAVASCLLVVGVVWMKKVVKIDV